MKIIKRSGAEAVFDRAKITAAVTKANESVSQSKRLTKKQIEQIGDNVEEIAANRKRALNVEEIQDIVPGGKHIADRRGDSGAGDLNNSKINPSRSVLIEYPGLNGEYYADGETAEKAADKADPEQLIPV